MAADWLPAIVTGLLGGGGAAFIGAVVKASVSLRGGARARIRETVSDLATARDEAEEDARQAARDRDFWRGVAGDYAWQLRTAGIMPRPPDPVQPSDLTPARPHPVAWQPGRHHSRSPGHR